MRYSALSLLPALAAASPMMQVGTIHKDAAPILSSTQSKEVPNSYMIVFKKHVKESHAKEHHEWVQSIHTKSENERMELRKRSQFPVTSEIFDGLKHTYNIIGGMVGYSGHFDDETIEAIRRHPDVSSTPFSSFFTSSVMSSGSLALSRHFSVRGARGAGSWCLEQDAAQ
jgi:cerevisin